MKCDYCREEITDDSTAVSIRVRRGLSDMHEILLDKTLCGGCLNPEYIVGGLGREISCC